MTGASGLQSWPMLQLIPIVFRSGFTSSPELAPRCFLTIDLKIDITVPHLTWNLAWPAQLSPRLYRHSEDSQTG